MNSIGEERPRRRFDPAFVIFGMGLLLLANVPYRPRIADMRPVDLLYLLGTGAAWVRAFTAVVWNFDRRRKG